MATDLEPQRSAVLGLALSYLFDPATERYEGLEHQRRALVSDTVVRLADNQRAGSRGTRPIRSHDRRQDEEWDPRTGRWSVVPKLTHHFATYPALFCDDASQRAVLHGLESGIWKANGRLATPGLWNVDTNAFDVVPWMRAPEMTNNSASVLLPPAQDQRYAIIGGSGTADDDPATSRIDIADLRAAAPRFEPAGQLQHKTRYPEVVITPDDKLVISGGSRYYRGDRDSDLLECHLYDPGPSACQRWPRRASAATTTPRRCCYPDGRIMTLGGNPLVSDRQGPEQKLLRAADLDLLAALSAAGPRPDSSRAGRAVPWRPRGLPTPDAGRSEARLMRPSTVTHVTDLEQRSIALRIDVSPMAYRWSPAGRGLMPSGWYMLFVNSRNGAPSVAHWVHVT